MTNAIVQVKDEHEQWVIYCSGDGHPDYLGKRIMNLVQKAMEIDINRPPYREPGTTDYNNPAWHQTDVPNVSTKACKFMAVLIGELWKDYGGVYLTKGEELPYVEHLYKIRLSETKEPVITWHTSDSNGEFVAHTEDEFQKAMKGDEK